MVERRMVAEAVAKKPLASAERRERRRADRRSKRERKGGNYFPEARKPRQFIPSGCTLLDCILGGGWVLGRVENIVGDTSTGKTLLAIEACANFARVFPNGKIYYREAEAAFDLPYATRLGLPEDRVDFGPDGPDSSWRTIEDVFTDLRKVCAKHAKSGEEGLYVIDSLDALTSREALKRDIGEGSYNLEKQKILSQLFEQLVGEFQRGKLCIVFVSQVKQKIGYTVGEKQRRSGGKSLDYYASHIIWLAKVATITRQIKGEKRATGVRIIANCKKNKVTIPFGRCTFPIRFLYGVDDVQASVEFLVENGMNSRIGLIKEKKTKEERMEERRKRKEEGGSKPDSAVVKFLDKMDELPPAAYAKKAEQIRQVVVEAWADIEAEFAPSRKKYA